MQRKEKKLSLQMREECTMMRGVMAERDDEQKSPNVQPFLIMTLAGSAVAYFSWTNREALGASVWLPLLPGLFFALVGVLAGWWTLKLARMKRTPALPAAPGIFEGEFAPDFRQNLEKLHAALPEDLGEMTLEEDYAFWYNSEHSLELVLAPEGWLGFFVLNGGTYSLAPELVQRAVADSPFAQHPVAQELVNKYVDMPLCGVAWCSRDKLMVYPYDASEEFTRFYADNLFAPAAVFDAWLKFYLETGMMSEES